jgi:SRSO17 transposase
MRYGRRHANGSEPRRIAPFSDGLATLTEQSLAECRSLLDAVMRTPETRAHAEAYVQALLAPVERKNSWQLAEQAGYESPYAFQHLLARAAWDAGLLRNELMRYVGAQLGQRGGTLIVDETGVLKKGDQSAGVARQYSGTAGRIENCQIGVFLAYARDGEAVFLDRALYLPEEWTADPGRCAVAGIPPTVVPATKPALAQRMLARAFAAGYEPDWVVADAVYGRAGYLRRFLEENGRAYVLAVASNTHVWQGGKQRTPRALLDAMPPEAWQRLSCGDGSKGPRLYDWAWTPVQTLQDPWSGAPGRHHLLLRRPVDNPDPDETAYFIVHALASVTLADVVEAAGQRWPIERCFQDAKGLVGLDEYEVRGWLGWHRHITLAMLAYALLVVLTRRARVLDTDVQPVAPPPQKKTASRSLAAFRHSRGLSSR